MKKRPIIPKVNKDERTSFRISKEDLKEIKRLARQHIKGRGKKRGNVSLYMIYCALNFPWDK